MKKQSAGILVFRYAATGIGFCLGHPGGPFYSKKDDGYWTIFKGEFDSGEDGLEAAKREFTEETGLEINGTFTPLSPVTLKSGKIIYAWAVENNLETERVKSNSFSIEWPPRSGKMESYPEIDKVSWFDFSTACIKIHPSQLPLLKEISSRLKQ
ncbi:MAG: hydrolase [Chitinophagaceae bacterium]|nr:hydrolase [Chitinophagaceae bacterium]